MITAVDSNVILDALTGDPEFGPRSREALSQSNQGGSLVLCEIVHAEIGGQFPKPESLDEYLSESGMNLVSSGPKALNRAGEAWVTYVRSRQEGIVCSACGRRNQPACDGCGAPLRRRQHLLADFIIGAHALVQADRLLTRDRGYYRRYFPELTLLDPSA